MSETGTDDDGEFNVNGVGLHFYTAIVVVVVVVIVFFLLFICHFRCKGSPKTTKVRPHLSLSLVKQVKAKNKNKNKCSGDGEKEAGVGRNGVKCVK